jgi:DNA-binding helix-hairpin-helix protein with protein kinase domain
MVRAGTALVIGRKLGEGGQGAVYEVVVGGKSLAVKWLRPSPLEAEQRQAIGRLTSHSRPHRAFAWPIDLVESNEVGGFGYLMPMMERRFQSLAALLNEPRQPSFRTLIAIARNLVDAFSSLHAAGLCYRDINFGNLRVDPGTAEVMIIDNDNVGTDGDAAFVKGTRRFMAPEIVRGEALPSSRTDFYSLAVLLFLLLVHGHPLEGRRVVASYDWAAGEESELMVEHFGREPLFVFDPVDVSNRPLPDDPMARWWPVYPVFLRLLFERSFTTGIVDPSSPDRCSEGRWRRALNHLADCIWICGACRAALFWDPDEPSRPCWACGLVNESPYRLELAGRSIVLVDGTPVTAEAGKSSLEPDPRELLAMTERHPALPGQLVIRNLTDSPWIVAPVSEEVKVVRPGQRVALRPMEIDFGHTQGRIGRT